MLQLRWTLLAYLAAAASMGGLIYCGFVLLARFYVITLCLLVSWRLPQPLDIPAGVVVCFGVSAVILRFALYCDQQARAVIDEPFPGESALSEQQCVSRQVPDSVKNNLGTTASGEIEFGD